MSSKALLVTLCCLLLTAPIASAQTGFQVIVHPSNSVESLPKETLSRLFLKKDDRWSTGEVVIPVDRTSDSTVRQSFSRDIHDREVGNVQRYWQQQLFSGSGVPPVELATDAEVVAFVLSNPNSIGYLSPEGSTGGAKVIRIESELGMEWGSAPEPSRAVTVPKLLKQAELRYPAVARRARYECSLTMRVQIDAQGRVQEAEVVKPCDQFSRLMSEAAVEAVRRWTFDPAVDGAGQATSSDYTFVLTFKL